MADIETATERSMQDISSDLEARLFGTGEEEPKEIEGEVVVNDEETLPEADDTDSDDDDGSTDLETIADEDDLSLAEYLGIPDDKLIVAEDGSLMYNAIVDGEEKPVALTELTKSFQLQGHVNNKSMALETERKEFQEQKLKVANELKERVQGMDSMANFLEQEVVKEYQSIDWDRLRVESPSEWAALRQEYAERAQKIQEVKSIASQESKRIADEGNLEQQRLMGEHLNLEREKMVMANPTWVDQAVLISDMSVLKDFVQSEYGFSDEDTKLVTDHRLIGLIQDAHKYRAGSKVAEGKKAKTVPKFQKSNAAKNRSGQLTKARGIKAKRAAVKKTGSTQDVANLLVDRM